MFRRYCCCRSEDPVDANAAQFRPCRVIVLSCAWDVAGAPGLLVGWGVDAYFLKVYCQAETRGNLSSCLLIRRKPVAICPVASSVTAIATFFISASASNAPVSAMVTSLVSQVWLPGPSRKR